MIIISYDFAEMLELKVQLILWMANNKWLAEDPQIHDIPTEYFYNFFRNKIRGLTEDKLETAFRELYDAQLMELEFYPTGRVEVARGLTPKGMQLAQYLKA